MKRPIRTASTFVVDHEPKCRCGNHAEFFLEVHAVDDCLDEPTKSQLMCKVCFNLGMHSINRICELGGDLCATCGVSIVTPSDMIVRVVPLDPKP